MIFRVPIILTITSLFCSFGAQAKLAETSRAERDLSTAVILSDSDVLSIGIQNFNPNFILPFNDDDFGDANSIELRNSVAATSIPWTFELDSAHPDFHHELTLRGSYIFFRNDININARPDIDPDNDINQIFGVFLRYQFDFDITEQWRLTYGIGNHLMYYENKHSYKSQESRKYQGSYDGKIYNTSAFSYIFEPNFGFEYTRNQEWGYWKLSSQINYFVGKIWGEAAHDGDPNGWYYVNGVKLNYNMNNWSGFIPSIYTSIKRIDLGGDPTESFGTDNYYEFSVGWLLTPPIFRDYIDNVGIGLNFNYGSALKGGSIVLFFNQQ